MDSVSIGNKPIKRKLTGQNMIKLNGNRRTVRETTAEFQYTDDKGELIFETIRVRYYSPRIQDAKLLRAEVEAKLEADPNSAFALSEMLSRRIESLPDLADKNGKPLKITVDVLENEIDLLNLKAIQDAIEDDLDPKSEPAKSPIG